MSAGDASARAAAAALIDRVEEALSAARPRAVAALACPQLTVEVDGRVVAEGPGALESTLVAAIGAGLREVHIDLGEVAGGRREARAVGRYLAELHPLEGPPTRAWGDWGARLERAAEGWCVAELRLECRRPTGPWGLSGRRTDGGRTRR